MTTRPLGYIIRHQPTPAATTRPNVPVRRDHASLALPAQRRLPAAQTPLNRQPSLQNEPNSRRFWPENADPAPGTNPNKPTRRRRPQPNRTDLRSHPERSAARSNGPRRRPERSEVERGSRTDLTRRRGRTPHLPIYRSTLLPVVTNKPNFPNTRIPRSRSMQVVYNKIGLQPGRRDKPKQSQSCRRGRPSAVARVPRWQDCHISPIMPRLSTYRRMDND